MISNKRQSGIEEERYILDRKKTTGNTTQYFIGDATHNDASCARGTGRPETRQPETEVDIRMIQVRSRGTTVPISLESHRTINNTEHFSLTNTERFSKYLFLNCKIYILINYND